MFPKIRLKLYCSFFIIISVLMINFVFIFFIYSALLSRDFKQKSEYVSMQVMETTSLRLKLIEDEANQFCATRDMIKLLSSYDNSVLSDMQRLKESNNTIDSLLILSETQPYYYASEYRNILKEFTEYCLENHYENLNDSQWFTVQDTYFNTDKLFYMLKLKDESGAAIGVFSIVVNPESLGYNLKNTENLFLKNACYVLRLPDFTDSYNITGSPFRDIVLNSGSNNLAQKTNKTIPILKNSLNYTKDYPKNVSLHLNISLSEIHTRQINLVCILAFIFLISTILTFIAIKKYINFFIARLSELTIKMQHYTENSIIHQKGDQEYERHDV